MAVRIRQHDWDMTPLGPITCWPQSLKTIVDLMLGSPSMMSLVWGVDAIHLYNDRFTELLHEHHAQALGRSAFITFARSRDIFAADVAAGMSGKSARLPAQRYPVLRNGRLEDAWFDVDYVPVRDETGAVAGVLWTLKETTAQVSTEQALRDSEARYRLLFDAIDDGFCTFEMIFDEDGAPVDFRYIAVNLGFEKQTGQRPKTGQTMRETFPQAEHMWLQLYAEVSRTGEAQRFVDYVGGLDRWYDVYVFPIDLNQSRILGALFRDVTEAKLAEEALRKSEGRHAFLVRFSDAVRALTDPTAVATTACRMLQEELDVDRAHWSEIDWQTEEFVTIGSVHAPGVAPIEGRFPLAAWEPYSTAHREGRSVVVDDTQTDPRTDSAMRAVAARMGIGSDLAAPVLVGGRLASVLAVKRREPRHWKTEEIALIESIAGRCWAEVERARAEVALRESDARLARLADAAPVLIWETDETGAIFVNSHYLAYFGVGFDQIAGFGWAKFVHPDDLDGYVAAYRQAFAVRQPYDHECRLLRADGQYRWHRTTGHSADSARFIGSSTDIHDLMMAEQALRENEERQAFLLTLSDALRPLAQPGEIQGETTRLLRVKLDAGWCYYVDWDLAVNTGLVLRDSVAEGLPSLAGAHDVSDAVEFLDLLAGGEALTVRDYATYEQLPARIRQNFTALGFRSMMAAPLVKEGHLIATLLVGDTKVRDWSPNEASLLIDVAERTWATLERARAEAALRESEQRFQEFANASAFGLWIREAETLAMEYTSPAIAGIYAVEPNTLLGDISRWAQMIHPDDREIAKQHLDQARHGKAIVHEFRIRRASDHAIRWIRNTDFPLYDGSRVRRIGGIAEDITEARAIQQELEHGAERLRNAVEVGRVGLWDWNIVTGEVHWSDEHFRMQGYAVGEVAPSYEAWAARLHVDDRAGAEAALRQAMADHQEFVREFRAVHPDGSVHWHSARGRFFYDDRGEAIRMIGAMVDTTERREWEERQKVLVNELQHRTRNLMGVVRSMSDKTARASADLPDFRTRFRNRLEALSRVQGLLSRLEDHDRVTFDDLIRTELSVMEGTTDRVTLTGPQGIRLRSSTVQTLAMALHELTTNAMKYGALGQPAGKLAITWSLQHDGDKPWLHIDWRESGVAMAPAGAAPRGTGQGRELIEKALPYQLQARTSYLLGPDGVHCTIAVPVSASFGEGKDHG